MTEFWEFLEEPIARRALLACLMIGFALKRLAKPFRTAAAVDGAAATAFKGPGLGWSVAASASIPMKASLSSVEIGPL